MTTERSQSVVEIGAVRTPAESADVVIVGGGLAGLTLAIQLKEARPATSIVVLEKREGPAPRAAFKVGESTVSSGAHYYADVVGMRQHLVNEQLKKFGLRYFLPADGNRDITKRPEKGPPTWPSHDNFQIDRGLFENTLAARARELGVDFAQGVRVKDIELGSGAHSVSYEQFGRAGSIRARWLVDAAGRASLLKRKLGLAKDVGHTINSAWLRLAGGLDIEDWGAQDAGWIGQVSEPGLRKLSTNHLMGEGYWVWLIPLSSGHISIGVCADPRFHPFEKINELDRLLAWFREHEPQLAAALEHRVEDVEDFLRVEDFSYGVERTYSTDRWSLVGEAGAFPDPLYSPGSDFIGYGNTFTTDLICRELEGEDISERVDYYNGLYQRTFEHVVSRYRDSYVIFGNAGVALPFLSWDGYSNHSGIVLVFVKNKLTDLEFMKSVDTEIDRLFRLNVNMHRLFRQWDDLGLPGGGPPPGVGVGGPPPGVGGPPPGVGGPPPGVGGPPPGFGPPPGVGPPRWMQGRLGRVMAPFARRMMARRGGGPPPMVRLLVDVVDDLVRDYPDDEALREKVLAQLRITEAMAVMMFHVGARALPDAPPPDERINPYAVGFDSSSWEPDGLYNSPGLTLKEAGEVLASAPAPTPAS